jgi:hypothetical protein
VHPSCHRTKSGTPGNHIGPKMISMRWTEHSASACLTQLMLAWTGVLNA